MTGVHGLRASKVFDRPSRDEGAASLHASELEVDAITPDDTILNDGDLLALRRATEAMLQRIG